MSDQTQYTISQAATALNISRAHVHKLLDELSIVPTQVKSPVVGNTGYYLLLTEQDLIILRTRPNQRNRK